MATAKKPPMSASDIDARTDIPEHSKKKLKKLLAEKVPGFKETMTSAKKAPAKTPARTSVKPITTATELKAIAAKKAAKVEKVKPPVVVDGDRIDAMLATLYKNAVKAMSKPISLNLLEVSAVRWLSTYSGRFADYQEAAAFSVARKIGSKEAKAAQRLASNRYKKFEELHNFIVCKKAETDKARFKALEAHGIGDRKIPK